MNNLCRMFSGLLTAAERLVFRRGAPSDRYVLDEYTEMHSSGHTDQFPADVLSEHLDFLQLYGAIREPMCFPRRVSPQILFRVLCTPAPYDTKIFVLLGRGVIISNNYHPYTRPFHPAMSQWWNHMNDVRLGLPLQEMSRDQVDRALIQHYLSAPAELSPSHYDCEDLVMLLVHTSPRPVMNIHSRMLVTPRREDYTGHALLHANIVQVALFMAHIETVYEYKFSVPPNSVPFTSETSLYPATSDRVLRSHT